MKSQLKPVAHAVIRALGVGVFSAAVPAAMAQAPQKVEKIEVTGSLIKKVEGETALPVQVITNEDIKKTGVTTASELLDRISLNTGSVYNVSLAVGDSGQPGFSGASLRGLGDSNTLILLNGRRVANFAFNGGAVDLNAIPLAAVERVEILKDGASAIYGTDAIGGVINFILRRDFKGIDLTGYITDTERGGGNSKQGTVALGYGDLTTQRFNVFVSYDYQKQDPLLASQREFAKTAIRPDLGFSQTSGNVIPANFPYTDPVDGWRITANPSAATGCRPDLGSYQVNATTGAPQPNRPNCRYDFTSVLDIFPPSERRSAVGQVTFQITDNHQAFAEYTWAKNKFTFASSETPVNDFTGNGPFIYPAGGPFYPTSVRLPDGTVATDANGDPLVLPDGTVINPTGDLELAWRAKPGGRRTNVSETTAKRYVIGAKGNFFNWDYNAAYSKSENKATDTYVDGWFFESKLRPAIATGLIDVFGSEQTAEGLALLTSAKILELVRISKATTEVFDARASSEVAQLAAGPLAVAVGGEHRREELDDQPQAVQFSGDIQGGGGNIPPVKADRTVKALFTELSIPIVKDLDAQVAVRFDDYSDFGNTTNPKVAVRWQPSKTLLLRGSYNRGFRAPSLVDLYLPRFLSNTADTHNDPVRCPDATPIGGFVNEGLECDAQFQNQQGGNADLQPEKSEQWSLGVVFEPTNIMSFGLDFFRIKRKNTIEALGDTTLFDNFDKYDAAGKFVRHQRNAAGECVNVNGVVVDATPVGIPCAIDFVVQVQENLGITRTAGVDVNWSLRLPRTDYGQFRVNLDGTYVHQYDFQQEKEGAYVNNAGTFTSDRGAVSRWRHTLAFGFDFGPWGATLIQNFVLGYKDNSGARRVGNVETWDIQGTWAGIKNLQVALGIRNMFDRDPPVSDQGQSFQVGYDPRYGDPLGRTYYARVNYAFK